MSIWLNGLVAIARVAGVANSEKRVGEMGVPVKSCSIRSAAQIRPPGLERRSTIRPPWGSSPSSRAASATNAWSSSTSNDQIRR